MAVSGVCAPSGKFTLPNGSDSDSFKWLLLCQSSECVKIWTQPLRAESVFSTAPQLSCVQTQLAFKAKCSGGSSCQCRIPGLGRLIQGLKPFPLGGSLCSCDYPHFCGSPTPGVGFDYTSPPHLPISLWFLLCIFSSGNSVLLVFRSFSQTVAL